MKKPLKYIIKLKKFFIEFATIYTKNNHNMELTNNKL